MKKTLILLAVSAILNMGSQAGISIYGTPVTDADSGGAGVSITGSLSSVSVAIGDVIVLTASTNKKGDTSPLSAVQVGGTGSAGPQTVHKNSTATYPTSWIWYQAVTAAGTFDYEITGTAVTAIFGLYVVRADSGTVEVAGTAIWDDTTSPGNPATHALDYTFGSTLTDGVLIESVSARLDGLEEASGTYSLDKSSAAVGSGFKRSLLSYDGITGSSWSSTYNVTDDPTHNTSGGAGIIFSEASGGGGNNAPTFDTNPVTAPSIVTNGTYTGVTLADYATDLDGDPMTFEKLGGPAWLSVATNGALSGTAPGTTNLNSWSIQVADNNGGTNTATLEILVTAPFPVASPQRARLHPEGNYNVLFIPIDDMRPLINAYGETEPLQPSTPQMDRLAERGIIFANAHCQQAVCNASRASLMTGLRPDTTRCWKLDTFFRDQVPNITTLPQHFGDQGYTVHGVGKIYHSTNPTAQDDPASWNDGWSSSSTGNTWYEIAKAAAEDGGNNKVSATDAGEVDRDGNPIADEDYNDGFAAAQGVAKIATYAEDYHTNGTPFFLAVGFQKPHLPFNCPKAYWDLYDPAQINLTNYTGIRKMPIGTNKFTAPYGGEPKAFDDVTGTADNGMPTATEARHLIHGYLACVSFIDAQIGKLLDALEDPDGNPATDDSIADNTIVVLWGDHGFHLGDHNGFWAKHSNYEISTRVPLIVSAPGMKSLGSAGTRSVELVELVDIYPTLVDLCSLPAPVQPAGQELQGTTFLPLLEDPAQPWKKAVFSQFQRNINSNDANDVPVTDNGNGMGYSIRTKRYRYTEWWRTDSTDETDRHIVKAGVTAPSHIELYDYVADPGETTNLASNVTYSNLIAELSTLLNDPSLVSAGDGWTEIEADAPDAFPTAFGTWKTNHLYPGALSSELDPGSDPDGDTLINKVEYKFGTHPFVADDAPVSNLLGSASIGLAYPDITNRTDIVLEVKTTANLTSNTWTTAGITESDIGQRGNATLRKATVPTTATTGFIRLQAVDPTP
jgi:iduronate 2-sulfatase